LDLKDRGFVKILTQGKNGKGGMGLKERDGNGGMGREGLEGRDWMKCDGMG